VVTIHYHGLPLTPLVMLPDLGGRHVCISFATRINSQTEVCLKLMQSIMFDNGAFSIFQGGGTMDVLAYYDWLRPMLRHPHWAIVPDVIDGTVAQQRAMLTTWQFPRTLGAPVWHLGLPLSYLVELARTWPRICFGSSGEYWTIGSPRWNGRMRQAFAALEAAHCSPWVHGLRMMNQAGKWPLASVDSVNIARNYSSNGDMPSRMADRIDRVNQPLVTIVKTPLEEMFL